MLYLWYNGTHMVPLRYSDDIIASSVYSYGMVMVLLWYSHGIIVPSLYYYGMFKVLWWYYGTIVVLWYSHRIVLVRGWAQRRRGPWRIAPNLMFIAI